MASDSKPYVPFSQRTGLEPIPPQLRLGEVSTELRRLLDYYISLEIDREIRVTSVVYLTKEWKRVAMDLHVLFLKQPVGSFESKPYVNKQLISSFIHRADIGKLFDLIEFFLRHRGCSDELKRELAQVFVTAGAAYRVFDNQYIAAIGTDEQAAAFVRSIAE